jgi:hypothetical protein
VVTDSAGSTYTVQLPETGLDWTVSPRFDLGYRFQDGLGELQLSYRFLATEGRSTLVGYDLDGSNAPLRSRLSTNVLDFDYATRVFDLKRLNLQYRVGGRLATVFFDSLADGFFIQDHVKNDFVGGGAHTGLDAWYTLGDSRLALFGRIDGGVVVGSIHQSFSEVYVQQDGTLTGGATDIHTTQAVPMLSFQAGLAWTPGWRHLWSRYSFGYTFDQWWDIGTAGPSQADLTIQGVFLRAEYAF